MNASRSDKEEQRSRNTPQAHARAEGSNASAPLRRPIRSYVLRQGRVTPAQQRARERLLPRFGVPFAPRPIDFVAVFGRAAPIVLEIGFGMGEATATIAQTTPEHNFLAVDVHGPGVGSLLRRVEELRLTNIRIVQHDAVEVVARMIAYDSLAAIHVFFPDPWPKKRHHKRRLMRAGFVHELARRLQSGGCLHVATDWEDYASAILAALASEPLLENTAPSYAERPAYRPPTKFERRGLGLGHKAWDIVFRRR